MTAQEVNNGNCHPEKTTVNLGEVYVDSGFSQGDNFQCYPLVQSIIIHYTECKLNTLSTLHFKT